MPNHSRQARSLGQCIACVALVVCVAFVTLAASPAAGESPVWVCPPCGNSCDEVQHTGPGVCDGCNMTLIESASLRRVAILVFPGVELLDFAGPGEVFAAANTFRVALVAETVEPLRSQGFVTITPEYSIATCPVPDILVIPGGNVSHVMESAALLDWIRKVSASARYTMSVCNGALVLAEAGLLDGKRATTHHGSLPALRRRLGDSDVLDDKRWVDTGRIGTAAGVSAGIDLSLHVVSRVLDPATAARVARYMEYTWDPNAGESAR